MSAATRPVPAKPRFLASGDTALVIELGDAIDRTVSDAVLRLDARVSAAGLEGVVETVPTFRSLMVHYDPLATSGDALEQALGALLDDGRAEARSGRLWRVPACYGADLGPDLEDVAKAAKLSTEEVVALHAGVDYHVYMIGFAPGFPYMGDLPEALDLPRLKTPRTRVPAGSVAIATTLTAVYPFDSPGGWRILGATPVRLFDSRWERPALLAPGDAVRFEPVARDAYEDLVAAVDRGDWSPESEEIAP
ncbi:5-oxoprolinase subunit PxpB [Hansschlegelia sp. KR7-227]|uniref:5-oxoprolinase subunit PxpB n=1 Tax=Hansschlegelia sp. KR7-227 TaxID=3400914 RepID=UPI003C06AB82